MLSRIIAFVLILCFGFAANTEYLLSCEEEICCATSCETESDADHSDEAEHQDECSVSCSICQHTMLNAGATIAFDSRDNGSAPRHCLLISKPVTRPSAVDRPPCWTA
jgi:hypothetical protein